MIRQVRITIRNNILNNMFLRNSKTASNLLSGRLNVGSELLFGKESIYLGTLTPVWTGFGRGDMKPLIIGLALLLTATSLLAQPADSSKTIRAMDTLFVIPAGPVAGSFTPAARISVLDTIAGWAHITVEGWVPVQAVEDRMQAVNPVVSPSSTTGEKKMSSRQCAATTKKGARCKRNAAPGSIYCWQHQPK
jgi:hypothetical protein